MCQDPGVVWTKVSINPSPITERLSVCGKLQSISFDGPRRRDG